jgi:hypothetical protein
MNAYTLGSVLLALVVLTGTAAALPGAAPAQADEAASNGAGTQEAAAQNATEASSEERADNETVETEADEKRGGGPPAHAVNKSNGAAGGADNASERRGPPVDMPGNVPDFVSDIHRAIADHTGGSGLGDIISSLTPDDGAAGNMATSDEPINESTSNEPINESTSNEPINESDA